jgi:alpha-1,6-mannosyltransferase
VAAFSIIGTLAAITAVLAEGRLGSRDPDTHDPSSWWGILPSSPPGGTDRGVLAALAMLGLVTIAGCWWLLWRAAAAGRLAPRTAGWTCLAWSAPFALGPPIYSRDVYAYAAQGQLARHGLDPATTGIAALGRFGLGSYVAAVDPRWLGTHAPYGSTAVAVEKLAVTLGGGPTGAVVLFRAVAIGSVIAIVALTLALLAPSEPGSRAVAIVLVGLNPVTVIHLVGGAHLDAFAAALLMAALVVERTGWRWSGPAAIVLATLAGTVKVTAFLGLGWLLIAHARRAGPAPLRRGLTLAADAAVAGATALVSMVAVGFGPTWVAALATSGTLRTDVAPAAILAHAVTITLSAVGSGYGAGHGPAILAACRAVMLAAAAAYVIALLVRVARGRSPDAAVVVGYGSLAIALGSPVAYPWYLGLAAPPLAVALATGQAPRPTAVRRVFMVASVWLCVSAAAPLGPFWSLLGRHLLVLGACVVAAGAIAAILGATVRRLAATAREAGASGGKPATRSPAP